MLHFRVESAWLKTELGGPNADYAVETVLPGVLVAVLQEDFALTGRLFKAQDYRLA